MKKAKKKNNYLYIFCGNARFQKSLERRFLTPNREGYIIGMGSDHFIRVSNKNPLGKCIGILLKEYRKHSHKATGGK